MKNNHMKIYSALIIIIILLIVVIVSRELELSDQNKWTQQLEVNMNNTIKELNDDIDSLQSEKRVLDDELEKSEENNNISKTEIKRLVKELNISDELIKELTLVDYTTIHKLETQGISDYKMIEMDLAKKPELIGFDGVLGGTMFFWSIHLLNDQWVYAMFEDGHIGGTGLYEYTIEENGMITWKNIVEKLYE